MWKLVILARVNGWQYILIRPQSTSRSSTMKAFIFSSVLLALAAADTCSDCTAVVSTIAARLSSEESIAAQQVEVNLIHSWSSLICRPFWWVDSAQLQRTQPCARLTFLDSGLILLLSSGQATGTPL